jgi:phosphoenolpyruvate carboxykinase (GTP)
MSRTGIMVTDSAYVVASMHVMTRVGQVALQAMRRDDDFIAGLHSLGDLSPDRRLVLHFPEEKLIWSVGSGYGGNALLGKKCHALRLGSAQARQEGWLAEHMLIIGVEDPEGRVTYLAAAMPSASGKTNLSMVVSSLPGWRVWTVGDDIAWMHIDASGQLRAINPERGFFGVAPNTSPKTNPNATQMVRSNTIFTNVALTPSGEPWWEGLTPEPPAGLLDWHGKPWKPGTTAAHPNSRFTVLAQQCPSIAPNWEDPHGVPISGLIFGSRRSAVIPLVFEAFDWTHGVFLGSAMSTETTAAITGQVGVVRRDPMAMLPFCGYNMGDYFAHWLATGSRVARAPKIFRVNWFRRGADGKFLWPGFGDNMRVLKWMVERIHGGARDVRETPIGFLPTPNGLDTSGLDMPSARLQEALRVDAGEWLDALSDLGDFYGQFGARLPQAIAQKLAETQRGFGG